MSVLTGILYRCSIGPLIAALVANVRGADPETPLRRIQWTEMDRMEKRSSFNSTEFRQTHWLVIAEPGREEGGP